MTCPDDPTDGGEEIAPLVGLATALLATGLAGAGLNHVMPGPDLDERIAGGDRLFGPDGDLPDE